MPLKVPARNKTAYLLISLLIIIFGSVPCHAETEETEAVRLETFTVGVFPSARRRYQIKDIRVGDVSVLPLFKKIPRENPAWWPGGYLRQVEIPLVINGGKELEKLKQILIAHPDRPLEVVLRDEWDPMWSRVWRWKSKDPYEYSISITVVYKRTTCDKVTRIVYEKIISKVIKQGNEEVKKEGEADKHLDVNEVFDKLRDDNEIEAYINSLGVITNNSCVETIRLLKSRTEEKATGFGSGEYTLPKKIQDGLKLIINAMATDPDWWKSELSLKVTGFTDEIEVKNNTDKELQISETGISADVWSRIENPFDVYYGGCHGNNLDDEGKPVYLSFPAGRSEQRVERITNNCELGAVRAYVAMVYLTSELGRNGPEDSYAAGGIYSGPDANNKKDDPEKRRVHIEIIIKAAKVDKSNL